jgi:PhoH-like ATPase
MNASKKQYRKSDLKKGEKENCKLEEWMKERNIEVEPLAYIRGRSIINTFFIVDEAQNLTPHEVKTTITRAGEGTKIILTGDLSQIDSPYLDEKSSGLSYLIDAFSGQPEFVHINLKEGERSALAKKASELL